jgi:hypothetical protein
MDSIIILKIVHRLLKICPEHIEERENKIFKLKWVECFFFLSDTKSVHKKREKKKSQNKNSLLYKALFFSVLFH